MRDPKYRLLLLACFFESHFDADLKLIIEQWPKLSVELRRAIVKMVE